MSDTVFPRWEKEVERKRRETETVTERRERSGCINEQLWMPVQLGLQNLLDCEGEGEQGGECLALRGGAREGVTEEVIFELGFKDEWDMKKRGQHHGALEVASVPGL